VIVGATADGLYLAKIWGHNLEVIEIGLLISIVFVFKFSGWREWLLLVLSYTFIRVGLFDLFHNIAAQLPLDYFGSTSWWDMFFSQFPIAGVIFAKSIFLIVGVSLPIKYLK
jgi:hypothetical protein